MPKFLEDTLKAEYGADSKTPYKVMNAIGAMRGNKETAKGRAMEQRHERDHPADDPQPPKKSKSARRVHASARTDAGQFDGRPTPPGMGGLSHKPKVLNNPKTLSGRRSASHANAYRE